ncbi:hypothetical protein NDU88_004501 [Pleurodeles waltl]|uniref:Uncharacterized protein n=1 Tax=Pleurodeles waltl TaxID=8319 RepID=A0AAV7WS24_PLEWA|nr:hypothetical protein NDU88_004501 [Pleurodeles waltl]
MLRGCTAARWSPEMLRSSVQMTAGPPPTQCAQKVGCRGTPTVGKIYPTQMRRAPEWREWLRRGEPSRHPSDARWHPGTQQAAVGKGSGQC